MNGLAKISLLLMVVLVSLSAYLRLAHSGIGRDGFPACYGLIGNPPAVSEPADTGSAYQRILDEANQPLSWVTPLHRLVASVLGLLLVGLSFLALRNKRQRVISLLLLGLTVYLAILGIRSGSLHDPAVVMGNLTGGFCMLGLLGWMVFSQSHAPTDAAGSGRLKLVTMTALVVLCLQILLGGLTRANFGATACQTLPDCYGGWWPDKSVFEAMDLSREHELTAQGQAVGGMERMAIHKAHRLGSLLTALLVLIAAALAWKPGPRYRLTAVVIGALLLLVSVGVAAILTTCRSVWPLPTIGWPGCCYWRC